MYHENCSATKTGNSTMQGGQKINVPANTLIGLRFPWSFSNLCCLLCDVNLTLRQCIFSIRNFYNVKAFCRLYLTDASVDWSDFLWLIGGDWRKVSFDDQCCRSFKMATMAAILDFRFLSMTSAAAHSRCPLRLPSWILFLSIISPTPGSTGPICLWLIGGDWRKVPFVDQRHRSFKMATMGPILDLVSFDCLTNASVDKHLGRLVQFFCGLLGLTGG
jgi:hypothetical protein